MQPKQFQVSSEHFLREDSFELGELKTLSSYDDKCTIEAQSPENAVKTYLGRYLGWSEESIDIENIEFDGNTANAARTINEDSVEPSASELRNWKKGKINLIAETVVIRVKELVDVKFN
jgi:hypothetical protein